MTFHCFSKSTVLFDSPSRKKTSWDWRVTQTAVLEVRSLARRFCFSRGGNGVTTEWNIYTRRPSREGSHGLPVNTSRAQTFHKFWFLRRCQRSSTCRSRAAKLSERVAVSMENGRHFGFLSGCAAQDVRATLTRSPVVEVWHGTMVLARAPLSSRPQSDMCGQPAARLRKMSLQVGGFSTTFTWGLFWQAI